MIRLTCASKYIETIIILPKGNGEYHVIGPVEVIWKVIYINIDQCLEDYIDFRDVLHGFISRRGTGTNTLKAKPLHDIVGMRK